MLACQALLLHRGSSICTRKAPLAHIIRFASIEKRQIPQIEPLPREELVTKFKTRLRDRQFAPGSTGGGFPEFLAEPRDSFPLGVRVHNPNQASLAELTAKCMEFVEENHPHSPAILFRGLPAQTADDFSIIAREIPGKPMVYEGGSAFRTQIDKSARTYTASEDPMEVTIDMHNEMSYHSFNPEKVLSISSSCNISNTRDSVSSDFQTPRRELKIPMRSVPWSQRGFHSCLSQSSLNRGAAKAKSRATSFPG